MTTPPLADPTCLIGCLLKEDAVGALLLHAVLLFLGTGLRGFLGGRGLQGGHHLLAAQGLALALL